MLATLLLAGIVAAPLSSAALLLPGRRRPAATPEGAGAARAAGRLLLALLGTCVLATILAGALYVAGTPRTAIVTAVAAFAVLSVAWLPATRRWNARGHLCWVSTVFLFLAYLSYILVWTFTSHLGPASTAGGLLLWLLEVFAAVMACAYLWELCDALGTTLAPPGHRGHADARAASGCATAAPW